MGKVLRIIGIPASSYYHRPGTGKPGRRPSTHTLMNGEWVDNGVVLEQISQCCMEEFVSYGYIKMTHWLRRKGYWIDDKKVYRLMKGACLTYARGISTRGKRSFRRFQKITGAKPLAYLEMDIKYLYLSNERRHVYLLSVLDVASRSVVGWLLKYSITQHDVIALWRKIRPLLATDSKITLRTDNGSQFLAHSVRAYLKHIQIDHEFSFVATPQDNGHIESFHKTLGREVVERGNYVGFGTLTDQISRYMHFYNHERIHGSLGYQTPNEWLAKNACRQQLGKIQQVIHLFQEEEVANTPCFRKSAYGFGTNKFANLKPIPQIQPSTFSSNN